MKQSSSMIVGVGLQRLQHPADAGAAGEVHALADLGAGADRRPGVDHGPLVDIGADVDERGHQHGFRPMKAPRRTIAPGTARKPAACEMRRGPSPRTSTGSCPTRARPRPPPSAPARITVLRVRRNDSRTAFFSHWRWPSAVALLRARLGPCPRRAGRRVSSTAVAHRALRARPDLVAPLPSGVYLGLQVGQADLGHGGLLDAGAGQERRPGPRARWWTKGARSLARAGRPAWWSCRVRRRAPG